MSRRARKDDDRGALAVITAIVAVLLLSVSALTVDLGNTWARRGQLQRQADAAAVYAAEFLPATNAATRLDVAAAAAYYIACHPVAGQTGLPACSSPGASSPEAPAMRAFGQTLLDNGWVRFQDPLKNRAPSQTAVTVSVPPAHIDFGFANIIGQSGTDQTRTASAKIYSPGDLLPVGLSLSCLASGIASAPAGVGNAASGLLPLSYFGLGKKPGEGGGVKIELDNYLPCATALGSPRQVTNGVPELTANIRAGLDHGLTRHPSMLQLGQGLGLTPSLASTANQVQSVLQNPGYLFTCSSSNPNDVEDLPNRAGTPNCVRTLMDNNNERDDFTEGFLGAEGRLSCGVSQCASGYTVSDLPGVPGTYNADTFDRFVIPSRANLLTDQLFFALSSYLLTGIPVVTPTNAIDDAIFDSPRFFWAPVISSPIDSTGTNDYPVLTFRPIFMTPARPTTGPLAKVVDELAAWIATTGAAAKPAVKAALDLLVTLSGGLANLLDLPTAVNDLLDVVFPEAEERAGLVLEPEEDGRELKAVRFMTLDPDALPSVPLDYDGPTTEYVGVGPRVVRLVE